MLQERRYSNPLSNTSNKLPTGEERIRKLMEYLFKHWDRLKKFFLGKPIVLFLDYDGTLVPIAETPDKAVLSFENRRLLKKLIKNHLCKLAIISGRALKDIKKKVNIPGIVYVGNHGLEIEGPKIKFKPLISQRYKMILEHIRNYLQQEISSISGAFVEDKGLSLSLHYRLVNREDILKVKTIFHEAVILYLARNKIRIKTGKMVLEVGPPIVWNKGKVVLWFLARQRVILKKGKIFPIYIGDDITDEDVFKVLKNKGLTIFVGEPKVSSASYYLKNTREVFKFLRYLADTRQETSLCLN